jgi:hypothetical protein
MNQFKSIEASELDSKFLNIPVIRNNSGNLKLNTNNSFSLVVKNLFWVIIVGLLIAFSVFALPQIFIIVGKMIGIAISCLIAGFLWYNLDNINDMFKKTAESIKRFFIESDPFFYLAKAIKKAETNLSKFIEAKVKLLGVSKNLKNLALESDKNAKALFEQMSSNKLYLQSLKGKLEISQDVNDKVKFNKGINQLSILEAKYKQELSLAERYASKSRTYNKAYERFLLIEPKLENEVEELKASVTMLSNEYKALKTMSDATSIARSALGFEKDSELRLAMDIVNDTIAFNTAKVEDDLNYISGITQDLVLNDDQAMAKFESMTLKLDTEYSSKVENLLNTNYKLTKEEQDSSSLNLFE